MSKDKNKVNKPKVDPAKVIKKDATILKHSDTISDVKIRNTKG